MSTLWGMTHFKETSEKNNGTSANNLQAELCLLISEIAQRVAETVLLRGLQMRLSAALASVISRTPENI